MKSLPQNPPPTFQLLVLLGQCRIRPPPLVGARGRPVSEPHSGQGNARLGEIPSEPAHKCPVSRQDRGANEFNVTEARGISTPIIQMRLTHSSEEKEETMKKRRCKECRKQCSRRRQWQAFCSTECRVEFNTKERKAALVLYRERLGQVEQASRLRR